MTSKAVQVGIPLFGCPSGTFFHISCLTKLSIGRQAFISLSVGMLCHAEFDQLVLVTTIWLVFFMNIFVWIHVLFETPLLLENPYFAVLPQQFSSTACYNSFKMTVWSVPRIALLSYLRTIYGSGSVPSRVKNTWMGILGFAFPKNHTMVFWPFFLLWRFFSLRSPLLKIRSPTTGCGCRCCRCWCCWNPQETQPLECVVAFGGRPRWWCFFCADLMSWDMKL